MPCLVAIHPRRASAFPNLPDPRSAPGASRVTIIDLLQIFGNGIKNLEVSTIEVKVGNSSLGDTCHCGKHIKAPNDFDASFHQKSCRH